MTEARSLLHLHDVPSEPWQIISVDLIGELPESQGYKGIRVFVDRFTKQIHAIPTNIVVERHALGALSLSKRPERLSYLSAQGWTSSLDFPRSTVT